MTPANNRAGRFVRQPAGCPAFIPAPLPPSPPVVLDGEIVALLSRADLALGRLDGIVKVVPDPDFFVAMYVRREAVLSSQIVVARAPEPPPCGVHGCASLFWAPMLARP